MNEPRPDGTRRVAAAVIATLPGALAANDPASTRLVYAMVIGLALIGIGFVVLGVWLTKRTRVDPPVLGPLELMGERQWQRKDLATQRRLLEEARPPGAAPLQPLPAPPRLLAEFDAPRPAAPLTDLGPGLGGFAVVAGADVPAGIAEPAVAEAAATDADAVDDGAGAGDDGAGAVEDELVDGELVDAETTDAETTDTDAPGEAAGPEDAADEAGDGAQDDAEPDERFDISRALD